MSRVNIKEAYAKLNAQEKEAISSIHKVLADIKDFPERYENPVQLIEDLEYSLQGLWKFPRDFSYHTHFLEIKDCKCPRLDNFERRGYGRITNMACHWHGKGEKE